MKVIIIFTEEDETTIKIFFIEGELRKYTRLQIDLKINFHHKINHLKIFYCRNYQFDLIHQT
jgi:hypothetical protein